MPVLLADILREDDIVTVILRVIDVDIELLAEYEGDIVTEIVILRVFVSDIVIEGVAVDEQDMKSGLQDRVADRDAALLRDTL